MLLCCCIIVNGLVDSSSSGQCSVLLFLVTCVCFCILSNGGNRFLTVNAVYKVLYQAVKSVLMMQPAAPASFVQFFVEI